MISSVHIHEVGPRDGLQVEPTIVPTAQKITWIETLIASGVDVIQLGSFVNPDRVPQMKDTEELFLHFRERYGGKVLFSALVLNEKGLDRGFACGVDYFCMGASASDTHSRKNTGMSRDEATTRIVAMARRAMAAGARVQVSVQSAFGCGFEGPVPRERVLDMVKRYTDAGITSISLADTAGMGNPEQVEEMYEAIEERTAATLACHFHDTYGMALANCYAAWRAGVRVFESAVAGLGGCPFTAVASGNVATEDLVHMFKMMGLRCEIDLDALVQAARTAEAFLGRQLPAKFREVAVA